MPDRNLLFAIQHAREEKKKKELERSKLREEERRRRVERERERRELAKQKLKEKEEREQREKEKKKEEVPTTFKVIHSWLKCSILFLCSLEFELYFNCKYNKFIPTSQY